MPLRNGSRRPAARPARASRCSGAGTPLAADHGFVLAESNDGVAIGKWMQEWTDLLEFEVIPVNNDEDVMKVLGA